MYHPGKVIEAIYPSKKVGAASATLEMWDGNVITFGVDSSVSKKLQTDDVVLVDYRINPETKAPYNMITTVVEPVAAAKIWSKYQSFRQGKPSSPTSTAGYS